MAWLHDRKMGTGKWEPCPFILLFAFSCLAVLLAVSRFRRIAHSGIGTFLVGQGSGAVDSQPTLTILRPRVNRCARQASSTGKALAMKGFAPDLKKAVTPVRAPNESATQ